MSLLACLIPLISLFYIKFTPNPDDVDSTTLYYSTLQFVETPLSKTAGSIGLSRQEASKRNHYRFTYDERSRLSSVAFFNGSTPREPNHTRNLFTPSHCMQFDYSDAAESITFFDRRDRPTEVLGNCARLVYTLNEKGFRESLHFENSSGERVTNSWGISQYNWTYNGDGTVIEERVDERGEQVRIRPEFEFYRLKLHFNPSGHIALMQQIDGQGNLVENSSGAAQDRIHTNAEGNFLEWNVLDAEGNLERGNSPDVAVGIQSFDRYGYEIGIDNRDEHGQSIYNAYGICQSATTFDKWGNMLERKFYNAEGEPAGHREAGYFHLVLKWSRDGNRRESMAYFAVDGSSTSHRTRGFHQATFQYDEDDNLTRVEYLNVDGELVNRADNGVASIEYYYDAQAQLVTTRRFAKDGSEIGR